ncbi:Uma2 family endonuclease [Sphaerisporangium sp. TRM90804]|uniref:Uma2 family endonuclease n=1 Tax=Sphaerisporangium sp. TRM90804 TaxID=3031113 RepID=UPI0024498B8D|nr:Uma2 family endonuclease [Sphaerisporangium sp. TRM90804]MDH2424060.1 Uma2 family endonuclease [Sphaerisporangium sp. TRM90804]
MASLTHRRRGDIELERHYKRVCEAFDDRRVEIVDGRIVIREGASLVHNQVIFRLLRQILIFADDRGWTACNDIKLFLGPRIDRYRPDLTVVPEKPRMWDAENVYGEDTLLVAEVVSPSSRRDDHLLKPRTCALAGVPLHLVLDPLDRTARLLSSPGPHGYTQETAVALGESLMLPQPWDLEIDTGRLLD